MTKKYWCIFKTTQQAKNAIPVFTVFESTLFYITLKEKYENIFKDLKTKYVEVVVCRRANSSIVEDNIRYTLFFLDLCWG